MKNLTKLSLVAASLVAFGNVQAASTQLTGSVDSVCEISGLANEFDFGTPVSGDILVDVPIGVRCNDGDGATVELRTSEGGLESDDNEDDNYDYTARIVSPAAGLDLSMTTAEGIGPNDQSESVDIDGSPALALGSPGALVVTLNDTPIFAGGYSDTLAVEITAR